ncbi:beta-ketoacyl synthase N-terminal-like domain-containing protein [Candidatus Enterovibrio altilux]|uniref:beta-ketoacyl synthase N-terminal-like domain-containing protein n=1 Tax=Candidatus Enterovibrio altilux TaxID=1927128 RepID=UPI00137472C0|nr:beta-ketoacyl synthase N-terminal-like domain-containing protein [Candidatus Enterovibrio luxaltus]
MQALKNSGLGIIEEHAERIGIAIDSSIGCLGLIEINHCTYVKKVHKNQSIVVSSIIVNMIVGYISIYYGPLVLNIAISTACIIGLHNIGHAIRMIACGDIDAGYW